MPQIKPLNSQVAVQRLKAATETEAGIIIPDSATKQSQNGIVVAIGRKVDEVKVGDRVVISAHTGVDVTVRGETMTILKVDDILAVME